MRVGRGAGNAKISVAAIATVCAGTVLAASLAVRPGLGQEDEHIYYGSRAGMHLTIVSRMGIGSAKAIIELKHTPKDAKAYCVEYERDHSMACVRRTMAEVKVGDRVTANCVERTWTDMYGQSYAFLGRAKQTNAMFAEYEVRDLQTGEILDGTNASGYPVQLSIFAQLCPGIAK